MQEGNTCSQKLTEKIKRIVRFVILKFYVLAH